MCAASYVREMTPSALGCQNAGSFIDQPLRGGCFAEVYATLKAATKTKRKEEELCPRGSCFHSLLFESFLYRFADTLRICFDCCHKCLFMVVSLRHRTLQ